MNTNLPNHPNSQARGEQVAAKKEYILIKLALDVHAASITVVQQTEGSPAQPAQKLSPEKLLAWVRKRVSQAERVVSCYEAGPTGYWLHRSLVALGVENYVVCPTALDSRGKGVNTDKTDAMELSVRLDRYVAGHRKSFSVVRVPSPEEEARRAQTRQREQLREHRLSLAAQGRTALLLSGRRESNHWWKPMRWARLQSELPEELVQRLRVYHRLIAQLNQEVAAWTKAIEATATAARPHGMGALTSQVLEREVGDWARFGNRRQAGSYGGLTGGVSGSGERSADLSVTKAGNRRLRTALIELSWRLLKHQPDYWLVQKWRAVLLDRKTHVRRRKQAIVAFARQLLVDLWRWRTGRRTPEQLGWKMTQLVEATG